MGFVDVGIVIIRGNDIVEGGEEEEEEEKRRKIEKTQEQKSIMKIKYLCDSTKLDNSMHIFPRRHQNPAPPQITRSAKIPKAYKIPP